MLDTSQRCLLRFRSPVLFDEHVIREICRLARNGFCKKMKSETLGFLFGRFGSDRRLRVHVARYYRGGRKSRTGVLFKDWFTVRRAHRRRLAIARALGMRYLGNFHSHVEIAGEVFRGLSDDDKESFRRDPYAFLEVVVFVWRGRPRYEPTSTGTVVAFEPNRCLNYRIRVYAKRRSGIRQVPARALPQTLAIIF